MNSYACPTGPTAPVPAAAAASTRPVLAIGHLLAAMALAAATAVLTACAPPKPAAPPPPKVTVAQPRTSVVTNWDEYPGHIEAVEMVELRPKVAGYLESIHFEDGAEVKAGDLLFVIDPKPFQADLERSQAERLRAETRADLARNDLKRAESLRGTKAISDEEFDTRSKAVREAEAALAAAKAAETSAQLNLDYSRVKAPIHGRIGRRLVTKGNLVQGGGMMPGTLLATLVSTDPVYGYFDADEMAFNRYRLPRLAEGAKPAPIPCELALVGERGFPHSGQVDFFDNQVDAKTGTIRVRGTFTNSSRALIPGMFARVRVLAGPPVEAMLVPAVAIGSDQGNKFVLVVNHDSVVEQRPIEVGRPHGALRVVTQGLTAEDRVIVNGLMLARLGVKVEVVDPASGPAAPPPPAPR
jgi:membrane fusion protein, multidrug efflux system